MTKTLTVDSNILIYAFDPTHVEKHRRSILILAAMTDAHAVIPMQCLSEFYSVVTRKHFLTFAAAELIVHNFIEALVVVPSELTDLSTAMQIKRLHGLQYFECIDHRHGDTGRVPCVNLRGHASGMANVRTYDCQSV